MPIPFRQLPWNKLTALSVPQFRVARRPMFSMGVLTEVGEFVPPHIVSNKLRLRQMYEARLIEPDGGPPPPAYQIPSHRPAAQQQQQQRSAQAAAPVASAPVSVTVSEGYTPPKRKRPSQGLQGLQGAR